MNSPQECADYKREICVEITNKVVTHSHDLPALLIYTVLGWMEEPSKSFFLPTDKRQQWILHLTVSGFGRGVTQLQQHLHRFRIGRMKQEKVEDQFLNKVGDMKRLLIQKKSVPVAKCIELEFY